MYKCTHNRVHTISMIGVVMGGNETFTITEPKYIFSKHLQSNDKIKITARIGMTSIFMFKNIDGKQIYVVFQ